MSWCATLILCTGFFILFFDQRSSLAGHFINQAQVLQSFFTSTVHEARQMHTPEFCNCGRSTYYKPRTASITSSFCLPPTETTHTVVANEAYPLSILPHSGAHPLDLLNTCSVIISSCSISCPNAFLAPGFYKSLYLST
jgi:hypothetical protein